MKDFEGFEILFVGILSLFLFSIFSIYIITIGNNLTESRSKYLQAYDTYLEGDHANALELVNESIKINESSDALTLLKKIED